MTTKRYRYIGKERDDESGFYYMGARYYCPWLARWLAPDPINGEWYNMCMGVPQRNTERQFVEPPVAQVFSTCVYTSSKCFSLATIRHKL